VTAEIDAAFPTLQRDGYTVTSPNTDRYNCVAWVVRDKEKWWEPALDGAFWPRVVADADLDVDDDLHEYTYMFGSLGFEECGDGALEDGVEKIALYAKETDIGASFDHVAFQTSDGKWSSKLGKLNDIRHANPTSVSGDGFQEYAPVALFMKRPRQPHDLADLPTGLLLPS
jgi:hypothetical protein